MTTQFTTVQTNSGNIFRVSGRISRSITVECRLDLCINVRSISSADLLIPTFGERRLGQCHTLPRPSCPSSTPSTATDPRENGPDYSDGKTLGLMRTRESLPNPTRIEHIIAQKVYGNCFFTETKTVSTTVSDPDTLDCICPGSEGSCSAQSTGCPIWTIIPCALDSESTQCIVIEREPIDVSGMVTVTLGVEVRLRLFATSGNATTPCLVIPTRLMKTLTLYAPEGAEIACNVTAHCKCVIVDQICP